MGVRWLPLPGRSSRSRSPWYLRYGLSYRDGEELLAWRGITVGHVTIYRWVQRFTREFIEAVHGRQVAPASGGFAARCSS